MIFLISFISRYNDISATLSELLAVILPVGKGL